MTAISSFLAGIGIVCVVASSVAVYFQPRLGRLLGDLCGSSERAAFWTAFANVVVVLLPVICALRARPHGGEGADLFFEISAQLQWGLIGLAVAVVAIGIVLSRSIAEAARRG